MKYRKTNKLKIAIFSILGFLIASAAVFMIVSLALSSIHGQTLVAEWQTWFGVTKESTEAVASSLINL